jgi:hypothetical protein
MLKNNYIVNINSDGSRTYLKNGLYHRESGPAIVSSLDKNKYLNLGDEELYEKVFTTFSKQPHYLVNDGLWEYPVYLSLSTAYYLNGIEYSKEEFDAIKIKKELKEELNKNLDQNENLIKKTKI